MSRIWSILEDLEDLCPDRIKAEIQRRNQFISDILDDLVFDHESYNKDVADIASLNYELTVLTSLLVSHMVTIKEVIKALDKQFDTNVTRKELEDFARTEFPDISCQCIITSAVQRWLAIRNLPY